MSNIMVWTFVLIYTGFAILCFTASYKSYRKYKKIKNLKKLKDSFKLIKGDKK